MSWATTEEGVKSIESCKNSLEGAMSALNGAYDRLQGVFDSNKDGLGPHAESIQAVLDEVNESQGTASNGVKKLVLKLTKAATIRNAIIGNNRYGGRSR